MLIIKIINIYLLRYIGSLSFKEKLKYNIIMEDWLKNFFEVIEIVMLEVENFFDEMIKEVLEVCDELGKFFEEIVEEININIFVEMDEYVD